MSPLIAKISFTNSNNFHVKPAKWFSHWLGNFQLWATMLWIHIFENNFLLACSRDLLFTPFTDHVLALLPAKFRVLIPSGTDSKVKTPGWPKTPPALNWALMPAMHNWKLHGNTFLGCLLDDWGCLWPGIRFPHLFPLLFKYFHHYPNTWTQNTDVTYYSRHHLGGDFLGVM